MFLCSVLTTIDPFVKQGACCLVLLFDVSSEGAPDGGYIVVAKHHKRRFCVAVCMVAKVVTKGRIVYHKYTVEM